MTRIQGLLAVLYAVSLQWHEVPRVLGIPIDGSIAALAFVALWAISAVGGFALKLRWHGVLFAFGSIFIVTFGVTACIWIADVGSHSRDVPAWWLLMASAIFAGIASSGLLLALAARSLPSRLS